MAVDVRELYHFAISASAIDPDLAAFAQETSIYEITGTNAGNTVNTSNAYVVEDERFEVTGRTPNRPAVYKTRWYEIQGNPANGNKPVVMETRLAQIEGHYPDRPSVIRTKLYQITS